MFSFACFVVGLVLGWFIHKRYPDLVMRFKNWRKGI